MKKPATFKSPVAQHERDKNAPPRENDPNRLSWSGLRIGGADGLTALPYTRKLESNGKPYDATDAIRFRILPEHPTRNPNGYVQQIRYKVYMPGAIKPTYVVSPESLGDDSVTCPYRRVIEAFDARFLEDKEFQDWWESIDPNALVKGSKDPAAARDALFKKHYLEFLDPWATFFVPVVLFAECEEKSKIGSKFKDYVNYRNNTKMRTTRLLELGKWKTTMDLIDKMQVVEDFDAYNAEDQEERDAAPLKVNSLTHGITMQMMRTLTGDKVGYEIKPVEGSTRGPLGREIREKLEEKIVEGKNVHEHNYPDVIAWKVKKDLKSDADMLTLLLGSTLGDVLKEKGILNSIGGEVTLSDLQRLKEAGELDTDEASDSADDLGVDERPF